MASYLPRVVDAELDRLITELPAISVEGPRGVGKTATLRRRAGATFELDDPRVRELITAGPELLERPPYPVLIDESQRLHPVWDQVHRSIERDPSPGRFLLTGSASSASAPTHPETDRIVRLRMRPMSLAERGLSESTVSLRTLLTGGRPRIDGETKMDLSAYTEEILRSGFPAIRNLPDHARRVQLSSYLDLIIGRDFPGQGRLVRRPGTLRAWLTAYAAATATTTSYNRILETAVPTSANKPAKTTAIAYRDVLTYVWLLDPVPGWQPGHHSTVRLAQAPKHHLADPALAARLLGANENSLLPGESVARPMPSGRTLLSALFESLVALNLRVYAQAAGASVSHLRTRNGDREVDFIVERGDGKVIAVDVRLTSTVDDADVAHLRWMRTKFDPDVLDYVVVGTGKHAYRRQDGIAVIPLALLGP